MMMLSRILVAVLWLTPLIACADDERHAVGELADHTLSVVNVIANNHVAAPTKQELVRQAVSAIRRAAKMEPDLRLGRRLSSVVDDGTFRELLVDQWEQVLIETSSQPSERDIKDIQQHAVQKLLAMLPGHNALQSKHDQNVDRQLAANRYVGIGIQLAGARDGKPPVMVKVFPGGPAQNVGARDGDTIIEIDGTSTEGLSMVEVVRMLRGVAGSDVEVSLQQDGDESRTYSMTRGVVPIENTHVERRILKDGMSVDVIHFDRLTAATVSDLRKIERDVETPATIVLLDFQFANFNRHHALLVADALLDGGVIGRWETVTDSRDLSAEREALFRQSQLFVLVSTHTVGTPEWVAAALQDNGRARIVGQQTTGQPFVSEAFEVPGTDWMLTLASGVLERVDGELLSRNLHGLVVQRRLPTSVIEALDPSGNQHRINRQKRDGGVLPDHRMDATGFIRQVGPGEVRTPLRGRVSINEAVRVLETLVEETVAQ